MSGGKHQARKRFGQNFLVDQGIIGAIIAAIRPAPGDVLVEIGPGLGALTFPLAAALPPGQLLDVVEIDRDLVARLGRGRDGKRLRIHEADALSFDFAQLVPPGGKLRVCGNLPYNISSPLLFHLMRFADVVVDQHFMLQKEVVDRMVAEPGSAAYGRLSVMLQVRYAMEGLFDVPPASFDPPPRVDSAVVRMLPLPMSQVPAGLEGPFAMLVQQAFAQRRKMLRNTLRDLAPQLEEAGIAPTARAEEVAPATYVALAMACARDGVGPGVAPGAAAAASAQLFSDTPSDA